MFSQFEQYFAKYDKIQIYKTVKTDSVYNQHKRNDNSKFGLTHSYKINLPLSFILSNY